jgi:hypothetical protein
VNGNGNTPVLAVPRAVALAVIAVLVAAASGAAFAESYRGLFDWAAGHGLTGAWAVFWPLQVDVFIAVGELALFVALVDRWAPRSRTAAWAVTAAGLAVSVAGNVGHVASHSVADRVTAAVPPVAAAGALAVALGILKRVVEAHHEPVPAAVPAAWKAPSHRQVRDDYNCGPDTAKKIRAGMAAAVRASERGRGGPVISHTAPAAAPAGRRPAPPPSPAGASPNGRAHG